MSEFQHGTGAFSKVVQTTKKLHIPFLAAMALSVSIAFAEEQSFELDIPAQDLSSALKTLAVSTDRQVLFAANTVNGYRSPAISGNYSTAEAMDILLADSDLTYDVTDSNVLLVKAAESDQGGDSNSKNSSPAPVLMAQNQTSTSQNPSSQQSPQSDDEPDAPLVMDEIIVTGTNIRGSADGPSPVITVSRDDIETAGFSTTDDLLRALPQNFDSGENNAPGIGDSELSPGGTGVNLRGLGTASTLVLVNGRRVSPGSSIQRVDAGMIPLSAVERVEVLPDGASAIYGSDAIAGVINFILRDDFEGAETTLRVGGATEGGAREYLAAQALGFNWGRGNLVANYEFRRRNSLSSSSRSFTKQVPEPSDLLPQTERHNLFLSARQTITDRLALFADGSYVKSEVENFSTSELTGTSVSRLNNVDTIHYGGTIGIDAKLLGDWLGQVYVSASSSNEESLRASNGVLDNDIDSDLSLLTAEAKADGSVFSLPGGSVKVALGGQFRQEKYDVQRVSFGTLLSDLDLKRDVHALYGEILVPIVGDGNRLEWLRELELTLAGRYEDYSDFGSSTDPKIGVRVSPTNDLSLRGSYSTSFRAPEFVFLGSPLLASAVPGAFFAPFPDGTAAPDTIFIGGGNPELGPEESRSVSLGFDFRAPMENDLTLSATYFDVLFEDRIGSPANGSPLEAFADSSVLGELLNISPNQSEIEAIFADPGFVNFFELTPDTIGAIADTAFQNTARTETRGLDFAAAYSQEIGLGLLTFDLSGVYLFEYETQSTAQAPAVSILDTFGNPVDLRLRGSVGIISDKVTAFAAVNYVDDYISRATGVDETVDAWTTIDLNVQWRPGGGEGGGILSGTEFAVSVRNLLDEDPPFVQRTATAAPAFFDGRNANALGQVIAVSVKKSF